MELRSRSPAAPRKRLSCSAVLLLTSAGRLYDHVKHLMARNSRVEPRVDRCTGPDGIAERGIELSDVVWRTVRHGPRHPSVLRWHRHIRQIGCCPACPSHNQFLALGGRAGRSVQHKIALAAMDLA